MTDVNKFISGRRVNAICRILSTTTFNGFGVLSVQESPANEVRVTFNDIAPGSDQNNQVVAVTPSGLSLGTTASAVIDGPNSVNVTTWYESGGSMIQQLRFPIHVIRYLVD